jgi:release factor glutamine methyltransferase
VIIEHVLGVDRAKVLAEPDTIITEEQKKLLDRAMKKRSNHLPVTYITHRKEFYGRNFFIDHHVLEPRPESETIIDLFRQLIGSDERLAAKEGIQVADVGTGSGAIGITAKLECPNIDIDLLDIDEQALKVARKNVVLHTIKTNVVKADLLVDVKTNYDILLCNLPYVPDDFSINLAAGHEPKIAIFGGKDGLDIYRKLFKLVKDRQHKPLYILTESLPTSHIELEVVARSSGYTLSTTDDFIQAYRLKDS